MDGTGSNTAYQAITVTPASPSVGAEIGNIDLTRPLLDIELAEIKRAFTEHCILFFRDQHISFEDHVVRFVLSAKEKSSHKNRPILLPFDFLKISIKVTWTSRNIKNDCCERKFKKNPIIQRFALEI